MRDYREALERLAERAQQEGCCAEAQIPMASLTTFRIGGPCGILFTASNPETAALLLRCCAEEEVPLLILGNGSNLLVSDQGYEGFILKLVDGLGTLEADGTTLNAGSGVLLSRLSSFAMDKGLTGLEFAHGIPGSVGGAVTMNAGAYDSDMSTLVREVRCLTAEGELQALSAQDLDFSYRHSAFSDGGRLILGATLELRPGSEGDIRALMEDFGNRRRHKQPLDLPSAGSIFKRPQGYYAAALIDECKLKGTTIGGAQVSKKHAGFIVNVDKATCADVLRLAELVQETVLRETGVELELEVRTLGQV